MKYYRVTCQRGHSGNGKFTEISFVFKAHSLLEAQSMAKRMPSVKHTRGILYGCEIDKKEYEIRMAQNAYRRLNECKR